MTPSLTENGTSTVTITAKDQYNNPISGVQFKYDLTVTDDSTITDEIYTIDGQAKNNTLSNTSLLNTTNSSGQLQFTINVPAVVDAGDGFNLQITHFNGSTINIGNPISFTKN